MHTEKMVPNFLGHPVEKCRMEFHQTYVIRALWDRDKCFTFWFQWVKDQGHSTIKSAKTAV